MFYDGDCPLCRREVAHYRRLDRSGRIDWIDIARDAEALAAHKLDRADAMAQLHVRDRDGALVTGAAAFAAVWAELPYYRWLARGVRALRLVGPLDLIYRPFARWRLRRRCADAACVVK